ncbi:MAG: threonine--tRNA ligase [Spirochaetes bacterium]|nr:threonine--tRNA ligase [Spirochaetota bacterium]
MIELKIDEKNYAIPDGALFFDALKQSGAKGVIAVRLNGALYDLASVPAASGDAAWITADSPEGLDIIRHSTSHIMALAVKRLYPAARVAIGPSIKDGFYYDFDTTPALTIDAIPAIEAEIKKIVKESVKFKRTEMSKADAIAFFEKAQEQYKVEIIKEIDAPTVSLYELGEFTDLCRGPHIPHAGLVKAYKLLSVAGAYWRGSEKNKMLSRIYGTAFAAREALDNYLKRLEEAKERDHRKIGRELDLFSFSDEGPGFPFWHVNGMVIYRELERYIRGENEKRGYGEIRTPVILNESLWHRSGHWDNFRENMYFTTIDEQAYAVKPMNCPGGLLIYKNSLHSYRELPLRNAELGLVHRHELSGVLHGLFRVRTFTQDDAHIFCTEEQLLDEIVNTIHYTLDVYRTFGFPASTVYIATRPEKFIGSPEVWESSTNILKEALTRCNVTYKIKEGEGAFYGPKIEFNIMDVLERNWQCGTIQVDFSMPARFEIAYEGKDGHRHTPVMVHRAIFGSLERFIGVLIEHYNGKFPLWLAPKQAVVITVGDTEAQRSFAKTVTDGMLALPMRVTLDDREENLGTKIRQARLQRIPYMVIIGDREAETKKVTLRVRDGGEHKDIDPVTMIDNMNQEIQKRMNGSIFEGVR